MTFRLSLRAFSSFALTCLVLGACGQPQDTQSEVDKARVELANGNPGIARIHLDHALAAGVPRREVSLDFAEAALGEGDFAGARNWLEGEDFPAGAAAERHLLLGRIEMAEGNLAAAARAFDSSYEADPANSELWVEIGRLRYRRGEQVQASQAVERALELDPENGGALRFRGQLIRDSQGMRSGVRFLRDAVERQPDDVSLRVELAATLGDAGEAAEALRVLRGGDGSAVGTAQGLFIQAVIAARGGNFRLARDLLGRSNLVERRVPSAQILSVIIDLQEENYASAVRALDRIYGGGQADNRRVRDLLAYALSRSGGEQELVSRLAETAAGNGGSAYLRTLVGRAYEALGDRDAAAEFLDLAAVSQGGMVVLPAVNTNSSDKGGGVETRNFVRMAIARGDPAAGVAKALDFARRFPGSADAFSILGDAELASGNRAAARTAYERSAEIRRGWVLIIRLIGVQNTPADARRMIETYVQGNPMNGEAAAMLADALAAEGKWARAVPLLDHAMQSGMGRVPLVLAARSVAARELGDQEEALSFALAAHELQPMNPYAISALIAVLPENDPKRIELEAKLRSVTAI